MATKKEILFNILLAAFGAGLVLFALGMMTAGAPVAHGSGQALTCVDSGAQGCSAVATTTPVFLTAAAATTTLQTAYTPNATSIDANFYVVASSSSSKLLWTWWTSNDAINWYSQSSNSASAGTITYTGTTTNQWTPGIAGTTTLNTKLVPTGTKYVQLRVQALGANASIYSQLIEDNAIPN